MAETREKRDLVVPPGSYAYVQDGTTGAVKVHTGPTVVTPSAQDKPYIYDPVKKFVEAASMDQALRPNVEASEGQYILLRNPAKLRKQPEMGQQKAEELEFGREIVIPGPARFPLWPEQSASTIDGHLLRSNQYLVVKVTNEEEARKNWSKAVMKLASAEPGSTPVPAQEERKMMEMPKDLTVGRRIVIRGTEVSFYIPPTGIQVEVDEAGQYVREALTLERLEYAILLDENGKKRYVTGPVVAFPAPTEKFMETRGEEGGPPSRKFRAIELNELQGLHLKCIADFKDDHGVEHKKGEEIFLTGKDTTIYYPREEVSAVKYDGRTKHFATAIPVGEGRYVMNRMSGDIKTAKGPAMLLPDPRTEVIVRRILSEKECRTIYPGNAKVLAYNQEMAVIQDKIPTTRVAPSEGDVSRQARKGGVIQNTGGVAVAGGGLYASTAAFSNAMIADSSQVSKEQGFVGDEFSRSSTYTAPRSVTLNTKFQGVPVVNVWAGYAVMVVASTSDGVPQRRVAQGPVTVLLDYNETLEVLSLSTGKPKSTNQLLETAYLRVENNQVTDLVDVETADHTPFKLKLSYRVNFEGDPLKWFSVENYVKFLTDEMRSLLKGHVRKIRTEQFHENATDILRDLILTKEKSGRLFTANGMRITDVEVLEVKLLDQQVEGELLESQREAVRTNISLNRLRRGLEVTKQKEAIVREEAEERAETVKAKSKVEAELASTQLELALVKYANTMKELEEQKKIDLAKEDFKNLIAATTLERQRKDAEQTLALNAQRQAQALEALKAESESVAARFVAAKDGLSELAAAAVNTDAAVRIAQAMNMQRAIGGESFADAAQKVLGAIPALAPLFQKVVSTTVPPNGSHDKKEKTLGV
jgi:major vault protein